MTAFGDVAGNTTLTRSVQVRGSQFRKGASAPTDATIGTTPVIGVLLFDATAETASAFVEPPADWDRSQDCTLRLICSLVNAETNADTLDWTLDYTVPLSLSTGSGIDKTSTNLTDSVTVTTGNGLAAGDIYEASFALASADATNPFSSASSVGFALEMHLTNITGVSAIHLVEAVLDYVALY
jgi:hypothetical protein